MTQPAVPREFRNDKALVAWIFMAVWLSFLALFTYIAIRDGGIPQTGAWTLPILCGFWLGGIAGGTWAASHARVHVTFAADAVVVRERWPFSAREQRYRSRDLAAPQVVESKDSEGDPYFTCVLELPGGRRIPVGESSDWFEMETMREQVAGMLS